MNGLSSSCIKMSEIKNEIENFCFVCKIRKSYINFYDLDPDPDLEPDADLDPDPFFSADPDLDPYQN